MKKSILLLCMLTLQSCMEVNFDDVEKNYFDNEINFKKLSVIGCAIQNEVKSNFNYKVGDIKKREDNYNTALNTDYSNNAFFDVTSEKLDEVTLSMFRTLDKNLIKLAVDEALVRVTNKCMIFVPYEDIKDEVYYVYNPSIGIINNFIKPNLKRSSNLLSLNWYYYVE